MLLESLVLVGLLVLVIGVGAVLIGRAIALGERHGRDD